MQQCVKSTLIWRQTIVEALMNKQVYYHSHPNTDREQRLWIMRTIFLDRFGLLLKLTLVSTLIRNKWVCRLRSQSLRFLGSQWLSFSLSHAHTQSTITHQTKTVHIHIHTNKAESPQTLWHFQRGLKLIYFFCSKWSFQRIKFFTPTGWITFKKLGVANMSQQLTCFIK